MKNSNNKLIKELAIFDIDNVLIKGYSQQILLKYLFKKRLISFSFYVKICLWFIFYKLRLIKDPRKIMEYAYSFLKDMDIQKFDKLIDNFFEEELKKFIFKEGVDLINEHKSKNRELLIVSNVVEPIVKRISQYFGIKNYIGTKLEIKLEINRGIFTGKIIGNPIYGKNKVSAIKDYLEENNLTPQNIWVYGDHISDLYFLEMATHPTAVNPDSLLYKEANIKNWPILFFKNLI